MFASYFGCGGFLQVVGVGRGIGRGGVVGWKVDGEMNWLKWICICVCGGV